MLMNLLNDFGQYKKQLGTIFLILFITASLRQDTNSPHKGKLLDKERFWAVLGPHDVERSCDFSSDLNENRSGKELLVVFEVF